MTSCNLNDLHKGFICKYSHTGGRISIRDSGSGAGLRHTSVCHRPPMWPKSCYVSTRRSVKFSGYQSVEGKCAVTSQRLGDWTCTRSILTDVHYCSVAPLGKFSCCFMEQKEQDTVKGENLLWRSCRFKSLGDTVGFNLGLNGTVLEVSCQIPETTVQSVLTTSRATSMTRGSYCQCPVLPQTCFKTSLPDTLKINQEEKWSRAGNAKHRITFLL